MVRCAASSDIGAQTPGKDLRFHVESSQTTPYQNSVLESVPGVGQRIPYRK